MCSFALGVDRAGLVAVLRDIQLSCVFRFWLVRRDDEWERSTTLRRIHGLGGASSGTLRAATELDDLGLDSTAMLGSGGDVDCMWHVSINPYGETTAFRMGCWHPRHAAIKALRDGRLPRRYII